MKFFADALALVLVFAAVAIRAQEIEDEIVIDEVKPAQFMPMGMGGMGGMNPMMMNRNQYPIDYSKFLFII